MPKYIEKEFDETNKLMTKPTHNRDLTLIEEVKRDGKVFFL